MDLATFERESAAHRRVYESARDELLRKDVGRYAILAEGRLLVADAFDEAQALVQKLEPVPEYYLIFPIGTEPPFELGYDL